MPFALPAALFTRRGCTIKYRKSGSGGGRRDGGEEQHNPPDVSLSLSSRQSWLLLCSSGLFFSNKEIQNIEVLSGKGPFEVSSAHFLYCDKFPEGFKRLCCNFLSFFNFALANVTVKNIKQLQAQAMSGWNFRAMSETKNRPDSLFSQHAADPDIPVTLQTSRHYRNMSLVAIRAYQLQYAFKQSPVTGRLK